MIVIYQTNFKRQSGSFGNFKTKEALAQWNTVNKHLLAEYRKALDDHVEVSGELCNALIWAYCEGGGGDLHQSLLLFAHMGALGTRPKASSYICLINALGNVGRTLEAADAGAKLLCFPENFSFIDARDGQSPEIAEPLDGPIMKGYCSLAREHGIWLSLEGFQERGLDDGHLCNTHVIVDDLGKIRSTYRKIHLFDVDVPGGMVYKESNFTTAGTKLTVMDSPFGRLGVTVCYALRFPELYQELRFEHIAQ